MVPSFVPMAIFRPSLVVEHHYLRPWSPPKDEGALALLGGGIKTRTAVQATIKYWYKTGCVYTIAALDDKQQATITPGVTNVFTDLFY